MIKNINMKMKDITKIVKKYELNIIASSTSFYMVVAIFSLLIFLFNVLNYLDGDNYITNSLIKIFNEYYIKEFKKDFPANSYNFSIILFVSLVWSSSKYLNGFNKASEKIYSKKNKHNFIVNRISSIVFLLMLLVIIFFEITTVLFANKIFLKIFNNYVIYSILQFVIELILIFSIILLLNYYILPNRRKIKKLYYGSIFSTLCVYLLLIFYVIIFKIIKNLNISLNFYSMISLFFFLLYLINYSILLGILINYDLQK